MKILYLDFQVFLEDSLLSPRVTKLDGEGSIYRKVDS